MSTVNVLVLLHDIDEGLFVKLVYVAIDYLYGFTFFQQVDHCEFVILLYL